jgi:hypothetical protein
VGGNGGLGGRDGAAGAGGTTAPGGSGGGGTGKAVVYCGPPYPDPVPAQSALLSDFEGNSGVALQTVMPGGVWAKEADGAGVVSLAVEPCGTNGNGLHFKGAGHNMWGADVAAALVSVTQPVDVSAFRGISFVIKSAVPTPVIFKLQVPYSQPACGKCDEAPPVPGSECYSGYTVVVSTTMDSQPQFVPWQSLAQQSWGYRPPNTALFDSANFVSIAFAFDTNVDFDVCIDDVKLLP